MFCVHCRRTYNVPVSCEGNCRLVGDGYISSEDSDEEGEGEEEVGVRCVCHPLVKKLYNSDTCHYECKEGHHRICSDCITEPDPYVVNMTEVIEFLLKEHPTYKTTTEVKVACRDAKRARLRPRRIIERKRRRDVERSKRVKVEEEEAEDAELN